MFGDIFDQERDLWGEPTYDEDIMTNFCVFRRGCGNPDLCNSNGCCQQIRATDPECIESESGKHSRECAGDHYCEWCGDVMPDSPFAPGPLNPDATDHPRVQELDVEGLQHALKLIDAGPLAGARTRRARRAVEMALVLAKDEAKKRAQYERPCALCGEAANKHGWFGFRDHAPRDADGNEIPVPEPGDEDF